MEINLKFTDKNRQALNDDCKCCTARMEKKGDVGDTFTVDGHTYQLTKVFQQRAGIITLFGFKEEGYNSTEELMIDLKIIYPLVKYDDKLWWHWFERLN